MKKTVFTVVIILLFAGCTSIRKDIDKERIGKAPPPEAKAKKESNQEMEKKISELEQLNDWFSYPMAQNRVQKSGGGLRQEYSRGGIYFEMYYDENELKNYAYYDRKLRGDIGRKGQSVKEGILYINPADKVAVYYYPNKEGEFDVFKVNIKYQQEPADKKQEPAGKKQEPAGKK